MHGGGDQTVASVVCGAGLDAVGAGVSITDDPPCGEQMVRGPVIPLLAHIRGGNYHMGGVADGHKSVILHGRSGD